MIRIVDALPAHVEGLLPDMRRADWFELFHSTGLPPDEALYQAYMKSIRRRAALDGDEVVALFGVARLTGHDGIGVPWFVATDALRKHVRAIVEHTRREVQEMMEPFGMLVNMVSAEHTESVRFLRWCGFHVADRAEAFGPLGRDFYRFHMSTGGKSVCAE